MICLPEMHLQDAKEKLGGVMVTIAQLKLGAVVLGFVVHLMQEKETELKSPLQNFEQFSQMNLQ